LIELLVPKNSARLPLGIVLYAPKNEINDGGKGEIKIHVQVFRHVINVYNRIENKQIQSRSFFLGKFTNQQEG